MFFGSTFRKGRIRNSQISDSLVIGGEKLTFGDVFVVAALPVVLAHRHALLRAVHNIIISNSRSNFITQIQRGKQRKTEVILSGRRVEVERLSYAKTLLHFRP